MKEHQLGTDNAQEMLRKAELALASGNFFKANRIRKNASGLMDMTLDLHRKFMKKMKSFLTKISDMEDRGYDVSEAMRIMEKAKERATRANYDKAISTLNLVEPALERAAYLPFPLLNKTVDIISTIFYSSGRVSYTVRIENPTNEPLGEIIISPTFSEDEFHKVAEKPFGVVGPREYKEYTFYLSPKKGKDWNLGVEREVLMEEGVTMRTKLSSKQGRAKYLIIIENNSDQVIRDVTVAPQTPGGLAAEPPQGVLDSIPPFSTGQVTFDLLPAILDRGAKEEIIDRSPERVIVVEEEPYEEEDSDFLISENEEEEDDIEGYEDEVDEEELSFDVNDISGEEEDEGPRDFTPVKEEYDLIEMAPNKYPDDIEKALNRPVKKKRIKS